MIPSGPTVPTAQAIGEVAKSRFYGAFADDASHIRELINNGLNRGEIGSGHLKMVTTHIGPMEAVKSDPLVQVSDRSLTGEPEPHLVIVGTG